jgi:hypothetical protein
MRKVELQSFFAILKRVKKNLSYVGALYFEKALKNFQNCGKTKTIRPCSTCLQHICISISQEQREKISYLFLTEKWEFFFFLISKVSKFIFNAFSIDLIIFLHQKIVLSSKNWGSYYIFVKKKNIFSYYNSQGYKSYSKINCLCGQFHTII